MDLKKIKLTSKFFLFTGILNLVYSLIVKGFLNNPDIGQRFKGFNEELYISDIYLYLGIIWIIFSMIYLIDDYFDKGYFTLKLTRIHFYFTLPMIIILIMTPILDTYYPTNDDVREGLFYSIFNGITIFSVFGILIGLGAFLINFIKGLLKIFGLIKE
jgi:hypothetical protein